MKVGTQSVSTLIVVLVCLAPGLSFGGDGDSKKSQVAVAIKSRGPVDRVILLADKNKRTDTTGVQAAAVEQKSRSSSPVEDSPGFELAKKHLNELLPVLKHLKNHSPHQYEKAMRDLDRSAKRLDSIKNRDSKLFDISVREWKTRGHVDLLKAKVRIKKSDVDQKEILQQLQLLRDIELERLERELAILDERIAANEERVRQTKQMIDRGTELRTKLNAQRLQLESETIDENSYVYLRATSGNKNDSGRAVQPSKSTSNKVSNDKK